MKTNHPIPLRIGNPPADLREWVDEQLLVKLALDAVQTLDWPAAATDRNELRPQMMLTLLSYCYAAGIYGSADIAATLRSDRVLHYICARTYPDGRELRHFRRQNRARLQHCLAYIFKEAWELRFEEAGIDPLGCAWFETELNQNVAAAIQERIELAMLMDGVETD